MKQNIAIYILGLLVGLFNIAMGILFLQLFPNSFNWEGYLLGVCFGTLIMIAYFFIKES